MNLFQKLTDYSGDLLERSRITQDDGECAQQKKTTRCPIRRRRMLARWLTLWRVITRRWIMTWGRIAAHGGVLSLRWVLALEGVVPLLGGHVGKHEISIDEA